MSDAHPRSTEATRRRPADPLRVLLAAPASVYRWNLGWLLGRRFLALTYRGRRSGRTLRTVLEVIRHDPATRESVVVSGYGPGAGWYRSIRSAPALRVQTGRLDYVPSQRFLTPEEARDVAESLARAHPLEVRLVPYILSWMGAIEPDRRASGIDLLASLPLVAFRPRDGDQAS
jgi:deazaflavin-dependent oxidoreductase (nitroreductase family)